MANDNQQIADFYTRRALAIIRYANGLSTAAQARIAALGRDIRVLLLAADTPTSKRALEALLRDLDSLIRNAYGSLSDDVAYALRDFVAVEATWAVHAGNAGTAATDAAILSAFNSMLVQGAPLALNFSSQADAISLRLANAVRDALSMQQDLASVVAQLGEGRGMRGGLIEQSQRWVDSLTMTATDTAAYAGRMATWKASGVDALMWHSVLDNKTTLGCAVRAGRLYTIDFQPIGHDIPIERPPPRHWFCRSFLVPMKFPGGVIPADWQGNDTFALFLGRHSQADQDAMLGKGRAELWRKGTITLADLVGQRGQTLTLGQLRAH